MQIKFITWAGDRKQGIYNWWPNRQPLKYLNLSDINNEQYNILIFIVVLSTNNYRNDYTTVPSNSSVACIWRLLYMTLLSKYS